MKEICRQTLERAYLILDGEKLAEPERTQIEAHLQECEPCWERWGVQKEMKRVVGRLRGCEACPDDLKNRIGRLIDET